MKCHFLYTCKCTQLAGDLLRQLLITRSVTVTSLQVCVCSNTFNLQWLQSKSKAHMITASHHVHVSGRQIVCTERKH